MNNFFQNSQTNPIIASISDLNQLENAINSNCKNIFLLTGNIFNLKEISNQVANKNKGLYIYIDLIDGFSKDTWGLEYIVKHIKLDGIITSKQNLVKLSKDMGVFTIQRMYITHTIALNNCLASIKINRPHAIEVLPGIMPKVIRKIVDSSKIPLIAGGLMMDREDMINSLKSGAMAISTSNNQAWNYKL